jgi:predicted small lipoprotein YifL
MKRNFTVLLIVLLLSLSACGGDKPTEAPAEKPTEEPAEKPTEAPAEEPTEAPAEEPTEAPTEEPIEEPTEESEVEIPEDWQEYVSENGNFSVMFPSGELREEEGRDLNMVGIDMDDAGYVVMYGDVPGADMLKPEAVFDLTQEGMLQDGESELVSSEDIMLGDYPGRQIRIDGKTGDKQATFNTRVYIVEGRLYQVMVVMPTDKLAMEDIEAFWSSFQLLEVPPPASDMTEEDGADATDETESMATESDWQEFSSEEGGFSVLMPGIPEEQVSEDTVIYAVELGTKLAYLVSYTNMPGSITDDNAEMLLDNGQEGFLKTGDYEVVNSEAITLDGNPGRDLLIEGETDAGKVTFYLRMYLAQDKLYQLAVTAVEDEIDNAEIDLFLDSFQLTGDQ